jgi:hypothetical protein
MVPLLRYLREIGVTPAADPLLLHTCRPVGVPAAPEGRARADHRDLVTALDQATRHGRGHNRGTAHRGQAAEQQSHAETVEYRYVAVSIRHQASR